MIFLLSENMTCKVDVLVMKQVRSRSEAGCKLIGCDEPISCTGWERVKGDKNHEPHIFVFSDII